ncbi:MAG: CRISPR-associated endonuclease Cas2 [Amphritea sp.]
MTTKQWYIIIYDVHSPHRLQRLHRFLRTCAYALQESVFAWNGTAEQLAQLQAQLSRLIKASEDDLRGYRLPPNASLHLWGTSPFLEGVIDTGYPPYRLYQPGQEVITSLKTPPRQTLEMIQTWQALEDITRRLACQEKRP